MLGLGPYPWLGNEHLALAACAFVNFWRGLPFFAITIFAGLVAIPAQIYEAAETDGATGWQKFWHITLPLLRPVLAVVILFSTIFTLGDFNIVYVLTRGGPMNSTHLFATYSFTEGILNHDIGLGAAISLFLFPLLLMVVILQLRMVRRSRAMASSTMAVGVQVQTKTPTWRIRQAVLTYVYLIPYVAFALFPLYITLVTSLKTKQEINNPGLSPFWATGMTLENYKYLAEKTHFFDHWMLNTLS